MYIYHNWKKMNSVQDSAMSLEKLWRDAAGPHLGCSGRGKQRRHAGFRPAHCPACRGQDFGASPHVEVYVTRLRSYWTEAQGAWVSQPPMWGHSCALKGEENSSILHPLLLPLLAQWANIWKEPGALLRRRLHKYSLFLLSGTPGVTSDHQRDSDGGWSPGDLNLAQATQLRSLAAETLGTVPKRNHQENIVHSLSFGSFLWSPSQPRSIMNYYTFGYRVYIFVSNC